MLIIAITGFAVMLICNCFNCGAIQIEGTYNEKAAINPRRFFTKEQA
jgi:hypothetical protein